MGHCDVKRNFGYHRFRIKNVYVHTGTTEGSKTIITSRWLRNQLNVIGWIVIIIRNDGHNRLSSDHACRESIGEVAVRKVDRIGIKVV